MRSVLIHVFKLLNNLLLPYFISYKVSLVNYYLFRDFEDI